MGKILGIDPGEKGAFVFLGPGNEFAFHKMPKKVGSLDFLKIQELFEKNAPSHVFIERAVSFQMGVKGAFNYGRGVGYLEVAIELYGAPVTFIEPARWTREMFAGISSDLKPKVKATLAVKRLFPHLVKEIPTGLKTKKLDEGVVDALLIAGFGQRKLGLPQISPDDF